MEISFAHYTRTTFDFCPCKFMFKLISWWLRLTLEELSNNEVELKNTMVEIQGKGFYTKWFLDQWTSERELSSWILDKNAQKYLNLSALVCGIHITISTSYKIRMMLH